MLIIVLAFRHLSRRMQVLGFTRRSQLLKRLSLAYSVQALLVTTMASLNISLLPRLNLLGLEMTNNNVPILRLLSAIVLMTIVYLVYSLVSAGNQPESEDAPTQVETDLINDLALSLANQICNVLDVDTVAFFLRRPPADAEVLCAIQGAPLNMPILSGEILTRAKLQEYLSRKYKAVHTVPIEASSVQLGTILIANRKRRPLSPSDTRFLYSIANQTGRTVLGLRSLVDQIEVKAIQEERLRISREMHDGLSPLLAYMRFRIEAAKDMLAASDHNPVAHTFEEIDEVISEAFADVRESIVGLRSSIADESLLDKLKESVEQFAKLTNIRVITDFPKEMPVLHPKTEIQVLRIVQEMLTNVRKHAEATVVKVAVIKGNNELIFEVADNGRGFNQSDVLDGHFGLATMRERSNDIGGRLSVRSKPGEGTRVTLVLPPDGKERTINDAEAVNSRRPRAVPRGTGEPSLIKG
jgi:signal transduction histidine kinase